MKCFFCDTLLASTFKCDTCGKGPLCVLHYKVCIRKVYRYDPDDPDWSIRCVSCMNPQSPFQPKIGQCFMCGEGICETNKCVMCGRGSFCHRHHFKAGDVPELENGIICTECQKEVDKINKRKNFITYVNSNGNVNAWIKIHPEWEIKEREAYMRRAEEKWEYVRVKKANKEAYQIPPKGE